MTKRTGPKEPKTVNATVAKAALVVAASAVVIAVVAVALGNGWAQGAKHDNDRLKAQNAQLEQQVQDIRATRDESRRFNCLKDQKFAVAHNSLVFDLVHGEPHSAAEQAELDERAAPHYVTVPDCSPEGIAAFYAGQDGTKPPVLPTPPSTVAPTTTVKPTKDATTSTTRRPSTTTSPPTTSTTIRSSPTTAATPCTGITLPGGLPCL